MFTAGHLPLSAGQVHTLQEAFWGDWCCCSCRARRLLAVPVTSLRHAGAAGEKPLVMSLLLLLLLLLQLVAVYCY
jgi:hypothetical protein